MKQAQRDRPKKVNPNMKVTFRPWLSASTVGICLDINTNRMGMFDPVTIGKKEYRKVITSIQRGDTSLTGGYIIEVMLGSPLRIWKKVSVP